MNQKQKKNICVVLTIMLLISVVFPAVGFAEGNISTANSSLAAFPGAEGGGMWTTGARNDGTAEPEVYHVTKLTDDGSKGTFRDAVSESNRVIVFDVAGNIELTDTLSIKGSNLTILGQTAPGDGVCVKNANTSITGNNVILRYMRFRMGDSLTMQEDTLGCRSRHNIIVDHCSISWCVDECASFYEVTDITMQWCIISESLRISVHDKGAHGYGGIWGGTNASFHHNLLAHHDNRNPRIDAGPLDGLDIDYDMSTQTELTDLRNNVVYNWGGNSAYGGQGAAPVNIINCYYKPGPATKSSVSGRLFLLTYTGNNIDSKWGPDLYLDGNYVSGNTSVTNDNSKGVDGIQSGKSYYIWTKDNITDEAKSAHLKYQDEYPVTTQTAQEAYESVLAGAGTSIVRDSVDTRVINEVRTGTATTVTYTDPDTDEKTVTQGLINTPSDVGGYPELTGTKAKDSDNDGIPNEWEDAHGLDKFNKNDGLSVAPSGYLYVEEYANALSDGSYVRNVNYDPDFPDYDPSTEPTPTPAAVVTPAPKLELVDSWIAKSGDENKAAGTEFMPGLSGVVQLERAMTGTKTYSDGFTNNFAITCKSTNGGWDAENGVATGCAMKYTAKEDGIITIYAYGVSAKEPPTVFYAVEAGTVDPTAENLFSVPIDEDAKKVLCSISVETGKVYYFYIGGGSKTRFMGAKFERYVEDKLPYEFEKAEFGTDGKLNVQLIQNDVTTAGKLIVAEFTSDEMLKNIKTFVIENSDVKDLDYTKPSDVDHVDLYIWNDTENITPLSLSVQDLK